MPRKKYTSNDTNHREIKRAAIYCRVSTRGQGESGLSLEHQLQRCEMYAASQGWEIEKVYQEVASAGTMDRPELNQMLLDASGNKFDVLISLKLDRLSRVPRDFYNLFEHLEGLRIDLSIIEDHLDTTTAAGRMLVGIIMQFASFERELGMERTRAAMRQLAAQGRIGGGRPPLGYDRVNKEFIVNPSEAKIVEIIYAKYLEGLGPSAISRLLNDQGYRTKVHIKPDGNSIGGNRFHKKIIHDIVTNYVYMGKVRSDGQYLPGNHEAIIDPSDWHAAQEQVAINRDRRNLGNSLRGQHLLNGLLRCKECGSVVSVRCGTSKSGKVYSYYRCVKSNGPCNNKPIRVDQLELLIMNLIQSIAERDDFSRAVQKELNSTINSGGNDELKRSINEQTKLLEETNSKISTLLNLVASEGFTQVEEVDIKLRELRGEKDIILKRIDSLNLELANQKSPALALSAILKLYDEFHKIFDELTLEEKQQIIRLLIAEVGLGIDKKKKKGDITVTLYHDFPVRSLTEITQGSTFSTVQLGDEGISMNTTSQLNKGPRHVPLSLDPAHPPDRTTPFSPHF